MEKQKNHKCWTFQLVRKRFAPWTRQMENRCWLVTSLGETLAPLSRAAALQLRWCGPLWSVQIQILGLCPSLIHWLLPLCSRFTIASAVVPSSSAVLIIWMRSIRRNRYSTLIPVLRHWIRVIIRCVDAKTFSIVKTGIRIISKIALPLIVKNFILASGVITIEQRNNANQLQLALGMASNMIFMPTSVWTQTIL